MNNAHRPIYLNLLFAGLLVQFAACDIQDGHRGSDSESGPDIEFDAALTTDQPAVADEFSGSAIVDNHVEQHPGHNHHHDTPGTLSLADHIQDDHHPPGLGSCGSSPEAARSSGGNYPNGSTVTYRIVRFSGLFDESFERKIYRAAFKTWSNVINIDFQEVSGDADFVILWEEPEHMSNPLAIAAANHNSMSFNRFYSFSDDLSHYDLFSIAAHEAGHVLGFGHVADPRAIMNAYMPSGQFKRLIRKDDLDHAVTQYERRLDTGHFRDGITAGRFIYPNDVMVGLARNTDGNFFILGQPWPPSTMREHTSTWHPGTASNWSSIAAADLDDDGIDELVALRNFDGDVCAFNFNAEGDFLLNAINSSEGAYSDWIKVVSGNFDASDAAEEIIAMRDYDDGFFMYKKNGGHLDLVAVNTDPGPASDWADMVAGDFDNDGQDEIIAMRNFDSGFYLIEYDGTNKLKGIATNTSAAANSGWVALGAGNLDGLAGDELVAVRDLDDGFHIYKFAHQGAGGLQLVSSNTEASAGSAWIDLTVGDYDDDGIDEIMAVRGLDEGIHMYEMSGSSLVWVAEKLGASPGSDWRGLTTLHRDSGAEKVAGVRNFDGFVYWYEYWPVFDVIMSIGAH